MLLSKKEILDYVKKGILIQGMIDPEIQVQQAGVDLTVGKIFFLEGKGSLDFSNAKRKLPQYKEIPGDEWDLKPGTYHAAMNENIVIPNDIAGLLLPRSSALVCGLEVHSALWDPGYKGRSFIHFSLSKDIILYKNARIAQMIFFKLGNATNGYNGVYKNEDLLNESKRGPKNQI